MRSLIVKTKILKFFNAGVFVAEEKRNLTHVFLKLTQRYAKTMSGYYSPLPKKGYFKLQQRFTHAELLNCHTWYDHSFKLISYNQNRLKHLQLFLTFEQPPLLLSKYLPEIVLNLPALQTLGLHFEDDCWWWFSLLKAFGDYISQQNLLLLLPHTTRRRKIPQFQVSHPGYCGGDGLSWLNNKVTELSLTNITTPPTINLVFENIVSYSGHASFLQYYFRSLVACCTTTNNNLKILTINSLETKEDVQSLISILNNNKINICNQLKSLTLESSLTCFHQIGFEKIFTPPVINDPYKESSPPSSLLSSLEELVVNIRYHFSSESDDGDDYDTHNERIMLYSYFFTTLGKGLKKLELSFLGFSLISFKSHFEDLKKCFSSLLASKACHHLVNLKLHYIYTSNINNNSCQQNNEKTLALGNLFNLLSYNSFQNLKSLYIVEIKGLTLGHFSSTNLINLSCLTKIQIDHIIQEQDQDIHHFISFLTKSYFFHFHYQSAAQLTSTVADIKDENTFSTADTTPKPQQSLDDDEQNNIISRKKRREILIKRLILNVVITQTFSCILQRQIVVRKSLLPSHNHLLYKSLSATN
jgi:hypothetical protein